MRIHHLQHVPFEGLGSMETYFIKGKHTLSSTHFYRNDPLPDLDTIDWLIVMGGPMGVHDDERYLYLAEEKTFIKKAVESGKIVMGICLGAQLIAHVLGAGVSKNTHREIGWFPITLLPESQTTLISPCFPERLEVFHWHGDRFEIPPGAVHIASSDACDNQGFAIGNTVFGFQFHLETTLESATALIENCGDELDGSTFVHSKEAIVSDPERFRRINTVMHDVLSRIEGASSSPQP